MENEDFYNTCYICYKEFLDSESENFETCSTECQKKLDDFLENSEECDHCGEFVLEYFWNNELRYCKECIQEFDVII